MLWKPIGASFGTSIRTRRAAAFLPLSLSVGMVTLAPGILVQKAVGPARLPPVRFNSMDVPRWMPSGIGMARVGKVAGA